MAFDSQTRNKLQRMVGACRLLLTDEFDDQLQGLYGIYAQDGRMLDLEKLTNLDDDRYQTATLLRDRIKHLTSGMASEEQPLVEAVRRVLREQAFTVLNRFAALRMAEERGFVQECVEQGLKSKGFQVFETVAHSGLGGAYERYVTFIHGMFDELSLDLGVLFDRWSPFGLLFPREPALLKVFDLLNDPEIKPLWKEDETIGWIYQYFNDEAERKKMREKSSAPRNSRELAVRNQFFTPRYVVEFLTDNTLGRIWYEMMRGETRLKERCHYLVCRPNEVFLKPGETAPEQPIQNNLSQEDLLKEPVHIPHRPLKDPRSILMLDPACGSMHFGLYAFDLFECIYDEAWELEEKLGADALSLPLGLKSLHDTYAGKDAFLRDVPRLIIEHNLHGIDIDPRCAQIAGLSLWLRGQKTWQRLGLKPEERPAVKRSNIVCAEPMPGEMEHLKEFCQSLKQPVIGQMVEVIFDKMRLAGEAGSLLKIEEEIRVVVHNTKLRWTETYRFDQAKEELFSKAEIAAASKARKLDSNELNIDFSGITDETFWEKAEERIYVALSDYAEQAENGDGFQRRLFAEDAARGFAFIDVCRKRYDVVLMNPPFGDATRNSKVYIENSYFLSKGNLLANFIELGAKKLVKQGRLGAIVSRTCFFLKTFAGFRTTVLKDQLRPKSFADLGAKVLDAMVETSATVFEKSPSTFEPTTFFRQLTNLDKADGILKGVHLLREGKVPDSVFLTFPEQFELLAEAPYVYWIDRQIAEKLSTKRRIDPDTCSIRVGLQTGEDFRFLRLWYEIPPTKITSFPLPNEKTDIRKACLKEISSTKSWAWYSKIDQASPFIAPIHVCVNWRMNGAEIKAYHEGNGHSASKYVMSEDLYFYPGFSYMLRSSRLIPYIVPHAVIPTAGRSQVYPKAEHLDWLLVLLASNVASAVARFRGENFGRPVLQNTMVGSVPFVDADRDLAGKGMGIIRKCITEYSRLYSSDESAIQFILFNNKSGSSTSIAFDRQSLLGFEFDREIAELFGFTSVEFALLQRDLMESVTAPKWVLEEEVLDGSPNPESSEQESGSLTRLISYCFGCAFGRWDIRYASGEKAAPELADPFAPLPVCPTGQLQNAQGLPAQPEDVPAAYPVVVPWDGILVDDPNHPLDIEGCVREIIEIIWKDRAEAIEHEAGDILGVKSLRGYFCKPTGFFADHLKRYSRSRRQAPIYWPLSTASGSYTLWIYYHRLTDQTLFQCVNDFVKPKLEEVNRDIERLREELQKADGDNRQQREKLEELEDFSVELKEFHDELLRVAGLPYKPNLNDGVLITASPLWKLFRLPKWQKDLKECWEALEKGEYDWAHLAYTIWPDRVKKVCKTVRSIAIAHGLEDLCTVKVPEVKLKREKKAKKAKQGKKADQMELEGGDQ